MNHLRELYQQVILDHNRTPRNSRRIADTDLYADGYNPLCGDEITVFVKLDGDRLEDIAFLGHGCAISQASASLMTEAVKNLSKEEFDEVFAAFHDLVTSEPGKAEPSPELGKLAVFGGVCEFPMRVKCATLPWHTARAAIENRGKKVTTE